MSMRAGLLTFFATITLLLAGCDNPVAEACIELGAGGIRPLATERADRFQGKVQDATMVCRGGENALIGKNTPWVDWSRYWGAADAKSLSNPAGGSGSHLFDRDTRGIDGALIDLEYQRMELIRFNLFDNPTYKHYVQKGGAVITVWNEMRLPAKHPAWRNLTINQAGEQTCVGDITRGRSMTGICNDLHNPAMGSVGQLFARNVEFEATSPELEMNPLSKARHNGRLALLKPDPQLISRRLFTRDDKGAAECNNGSGNGTTAKSVNCPYAEAPFFNVLAAYWIQFMTHDWFTHLDNARNDMTHIMKLGCTDGDDKYGCRPDDHMDSALIAQAGTPPTVAVDGKDRLARAYKTTANYNTAWWDASQIYGFDEKSGRRVKRDPHDSARLMMTAPSAPKTDGDKQGYLPVLSAPCANDSQHGCDPMRPEWTGQEATGFADNWSIGMSFYHNMFVREHNKFVDSFRERMKATPTADSGLRNPAHPDKPIPYAGVTSNELFAMARLVVSAEIAKIHTIEWTTQLLYDEPLYRAMNSNWSGLLKDGSLAAKLTARLVDRLAGSKDEVKRNQLYSALAAGSGILGMSQTNHFGAPFNFPEEFMSVYRLHPLLPDLLELRDVKAPNDVTAKVPVISTFRGKATEAMHAHGLSDWALSMGRQRLGLLQLRNHPRFLQNIDLRPRVDSQIDVPALDLIRDRERGVPRYNEFRRQLGLRMITSYNDFINRSVAVGSDEYKREADIVKTMREIYGQHRCDMSKIISTAQRMPDGGAVTDCLGFPDGTTVDNVEDLDNIVGYLAETTRPHGFAISETQFHVFILNASRRLFSDRFFTSDYRPAYYSTLGIDWVENNGPDGVVYEAGEPNGHKQEMSPLKRVMLRTMPELREELAQVVNVFDPWARDRGTYYTLNWKPRAGAEGDAAFPKPTTK